MNNNKAETFYHKPIQAEPEANGGRIEDGKYQMLKLSFSIPIFILGIGNICFTCPVP